MIKNFIAVLLLFSTVALHAQTYHLNFVNPTINGSKFRVSVKMSADKTFSLGSNNIRLSYPASDLANPKIVAENFPQGFAATNLVGSNQATGVLSINTAYTSKPNANLLTINKEGKDLVTLEFDIIKENPNTTLSFRTGKSFPKCAVITDDSKQIVEEGKFNEMVLNHNYQSPALQPKVNNEDIITISPNPTSDIINLDFISKEEANQNVIIADVNGKICKTQMVNVVKGHNLITLELKDFAASTYLITLGTVSKKVIKQ